MSRHVFPYVPGMTLLYSRQLDRRLHLSEAEIVLEGLAASFDGLRILLVSDVHAGPFLDPGALRRALERLAGERPDLIVLAGDLATSRLDELERAREAFSALTAPLGVYAVPGNHDHYAGPSAAWRTIVSGFGIRVLWNASVAVESRGERLWLAGIDDWLVGRPDLDAALHGSRPPVLLVSHNPDALFEAARRGVALVLSGHTHAGQIRVPGLPVLVRQSRFRLDEGRFRYRATELVVSRGLGAVGLPFRCACPPEAVLLTLRPARR